MNFDLIYPMAAMVLLTALVLFRLFRARVRAVKSGDVPATYYKTYQGASEPRNVAQSSRHFINLFESPTLFYAACLAGIVVASGHSLLLILAWIFVALRCLHALVHLGANKIPSRIAAYLASWIVLVAMWAVLVFDVANR